MRRVHEGVREAIRDLDEGALNWIPGEEANSIAILVVHLLGNEADVLRTVRGLPSDRDRDAEFRARSRADDLLRLVDAADALLTELGAAITAQDLGTPRLRAADPTGLAQPGRLLLFNSYGHAREHLGQLLVTKQLYLQERRTAQR